MTLVVGREAQRNHRRVKFVRFVLALGESSYGISPSSIADRGHRLAVRRSVGRSSDPPRRLRGIMDGCFRPRPVSFYRSFAVMNDVFVEGILDIG